MESLAPKPDIVPEPEHEVPRSSDDRQENESIDPSKVPPLGAQVSNLAAIAHGNVAGAPESTQALPSASAGILENQIKALKLENEALKNTNRELNDNCMKLEFDKQHAEKQCRVLHRQMEKLTQVLDKLKGGGSLD